MRGPGERPAVEWERRVRLTSQSLSYSITSRELPSTCVDRAGNGEGG